MGEERGRPSAFWISHLIRIKIAHVLNIHLLPKGLIRAHIEPEPGHWKFSLAGFMRRLEYSRYHFHGGTFRVTRRLKERFPLLPMYQQVKYY